MSVIGDRTVVVNDHYDENWDDRFTIDAKKNGQNAIINKLSTVSSENGDTYLVRSRNIQRTVRAPGDGFAKAKLYSPIKVSDNAVAAATTIVQEKKVADTVLPYERNVREYNPETDILSDNNILVISRDAADIIEAVGWDVDGLSSEYERVESVAPNAYQSNIADDIVIIKRDIRDVMDRIAALIQYYKSKGQLNGVNTIRQLYSIDELPSDLARELADFSGLYEKYMELQRVIIGETAERIEIPDMFIEAYKQKRDEFVDEVISMGDNVVKI